MNETCSSSSSCLAIVEKKPAPKHGGCVGIFFQLFDWNRRLAKKKLFSKKLLPPARAKQASKKFGVNDKLLSAPKLHLIDDENRGGFPNARKNGVDKEQRHDRQAPSLVARLMGLESMPDSRRDKPKKALGFANSKDRGETSDGDYKGLNKEDSNMQKGRPQKLQKTGEVDRQAVTRFGSEAFQFKNVLSRARKHQHHQQHPKLASPVKSPRVGKNASRWIDAATKILEPKLQASNRAKCALTYSNVLQYLPKDKTMIDENPVFSSVPRQTGYYTNATNSFVGQSSCENCGNHDLSEVVILRPIVEEHPPVFGSSISSYVYSATFQGSEYSKPRPTTSLSPEQERDVDFQSYDQAVFLASKARNKINSHNEPLRGAKPFSSNGQERWHFSSQPRKPLKDEHTPISLKHMARTPSQLSMNRERIATKSKLSNMHNRRVASTVNGVSSGPKDFVSLNRNVSNRARPRMPNRVDKSISEDERKSYSMQDDSFSNNRTPVRKRRTVNANGQVDSSKLSQASTRQEKNCTTSKSAYQGGGNNDCSIKNIDSVSFAFNSPVKKKMMLCPNEIENKGIRDNYTDRSVSECRKSILNENDGRTSFSKPLSLSGDALGVLLVQKLKELTSPEEDELAAGGAPPKRTTAVILQELISALTAEQPTSKNGVAIGINQGGESYYSNQDPHDHLFSHGRTYNGDEAPQANTKKPGNRARGLHDGDYFSPGSVLEASFSTDSCISSSLDDNFGHRAHVHELMDFSYDLPQTSQPDIEYVDSATSFDKPRTGIDMAADVVNLVTKLLHDTNLSNIQLSGTKLSHVKDVLLNAELLFGNSNTTPDIKKFSMSAFLLNELETVAAALWTNSNCLAGFEDDGTESLLNGFLFDCVIEYLDRHYARYSKSGFKACTKLPLCMNTEMLIRGVGEEVKSWADLAELDPDVVIEWEMSHSLGKWTDFDIEAFESGAEIDVDILQSLVSEIVNDLWEESRIASF